MAEPTPKPEVEQVADEAADMDEGQGDNANAAAVASQLMRNPGVLAALQDKLGSMVGGPSGYIQSLPKVVKRRIKALKKLQFKTIEVEAKFYEEVHELECKYADQYAPIFERRKEITTGGVEPTDSDCDWPSDDEDEEDELADDLQTKAKVEEIDETKEKQDKEEAEKAKKEEENVSGVPEFWLTIFKNVEMLSDMIQEQDEPILKHLQDIKVRFQQASPVGFTLDFVFSPNEYFTNTLLTKEYIMRCEADETDPFSYEGPEIIKCKGCKIDWNKGKNVTVKVIKKAQSHRGNRGTKRMLTKTIQKDSFFNFFNPPEVPEGDVPDEETEQLLGADFEIGHFIRERIVPRAVLYFTGEALDDDEYDEEGEEEEGEDDEEDEDGDYDEDADGDYDPKKDQQAADCKQQ